MEENTVKIVTTDILLIELRGLKNWLIQQDIYTDPDIDLDSHDPSEEAGYRSAIINIAGKIDEILSRYETSSLSVTPVICLKQPQTPLKPAFNGPAGEAAQTARKPATSEPVAVVQWAHCRSDLQRFIAFYVERFNPTLYLHGTKEQVSAYYKTYGRQFSNLLGVAGTLEIACEALVEFSDFYEKKAWSWNLKTLTINFGEFVELTMKKRRGEAK